MFRIYPFFSFTAIFIRISLKDMRNFRLLEAKNADANDDSNENDETNDAYDENYKVLVSYNIHNHQEKRSGRSYKWVDKMSLG